MNIVERVFFLRSLLPIIIVHKLHLTSIIYNDLRRFGFPGNSMGIHKALLKNKIFRRSIIRDVLDCSVIWFG